eukprot:NODE_192_length_15450_cov_0.476355.p3 type:complete len:275 gc:universal NODE_192_length_15450_cov_0.476355:6404-5580(-)
MSSKVASNYQLRQPKVGNVASLTKTHKEEMNSIKTYSQFFSDFTIDEHWDYFGTEKFETFVYDNTDFDFLKDGIIVSNVISDTKKVRSYQEISCLGHAQVIDTGDQVPPSFYCDLLQRLSFKTERNIYKYNFKNRGHSKRRNLNKLFLYQDAVIFEDGDPYFVSELKCDLYDFFKYFNISQCKNSSRLTIFEGLYRYHQDVYDEVSNKNIISPPREKVYRNNWDALDLLEKQELTPEKQHALLLRFQGRLFEGERLKMEERNYHEALMPEEDSE